MTLFTWLMAGLSIVGVILNGYQDRRCFYVYMVTNSSWAAVDLYNGIYAQGVMFLVYLALSVWSLSRWKSGGMNGKST